MPSLPANSDEKKPIYSDHLRIEARSLAMHRLVARKLLADPALLDKARKYLQRWQKDGDPSQARAEWAAILSGTAEQVAEFLGDTSERATRLRQSSPFAGFLTEDERSAIYAHYRMGEWKPLPSPDFP